MVSDPPAVYTVPTATPTNVGAVFASPAAAPAAIGPAFDPGFGPGSQIDISGVTSPAGLNGRAFKWGTANGKPKFAPLNFIPAVSGDGIVCEWSGSAWNLYLLAGGSTIDGKYFSSSSAVATPELATGWAGSGGATGSPVVVACALPPAITP